MISIGVERQLKSFGLNTYEIKIWAALLSLGNSTAGQLSSVANVPRSRSYDVLGSLKVKGFVKIKQGKPISYIPVSPQEALDNVKKQIRQDSSDEIQKLSSLKNNELVEKLSELHIKSTSQINNSQLSGTLKGTSNIFNHIREMITRANKNVLISASAKEFSLLAEQFEEQFAKLKKKNVEIKILTQINSSNKKKADKMKNICEVKNSSRNSRFCIIDSKEMLFMISDDDEVHPSYDVGIWVNTSLAKEFEKLVG